MTNIGHNNPPSEYDTIKQTVNDLVMEAKHWADGEGVKTEKNASHVSGLIDLLRKQNTALNKWHKVEKEPHLVAGKEVDAKKREVAQVITRATTSLKETLAPYLAEQDRIKQEEADRKRKEAEEAERKRQEAIAQADKSNLESVEQREVAIADAKKAEAAAKRATKEKANAKSDFGRAKGLRTDWECVLMDPSAAFEYFKNKREVTELLERMALAEVRRTKGEGIPGFIVNEIKKVV